MTNPRSASSPQRTWISYDASILGYVRTEDHTTISKQWIARLIDELDWQPAPSDLTKLSDSLRTALEWFRRSDIRQIAEAPGLESVGLEFHGIEISCPFGLVRMYVLDHGSGPMPVCRDIWFDDPDLARDSNQ